MEAPATGPALKKRKLVLPKAAAVMEEELIEEYPPIEDDDPAELESAKPQDPPPKNSRTKAKAKAPETPRPTASATATEDMVFRLTFVQGNIIKEIVKVMRDLIEVVNFSFTDAGVQVRCIDSSRVAMVALTIQAAYDPSYFCAHSVTLGISLIHLVTLLGSVKADSRVEFCMLKGEDDSVQVTIYRNDTTSVVYALKLMDLEEDMLGNPESPVTCTVTLPSDHLNTILNDLRHVGDVVKFQVGKEGMLLTGGGSDSSVGRAIVECRASSRENSPNSYVEIKCDKIPGPQTFSLKYMLLFARAHTCAPEVQLYFFGDESPIGVTFHACPELSLQFYVAPKIEDLD